MNGVWSTIDVAGKKADVYDLPAGVKPRYGVLFLHSASLETLRGRLAYTKIFDAKQLVCICPQAGRSWWADRVCSEFDSALTPEQHLLKNLLPLFQSRWSLAARAIGIFG